MTAAARPLALEGPVAEIAPTPSAESPKAQAGASKWVIAVAVALGALLEVIDSSIVNVGLTDMQASLGATVTQISWVVSSYAIANVIILPLSAWLGHRFGKKRYFVFSLLGFTAASVMCGLSTTLMMLTISRVLQGLFGGGLLAKAQTILFETFPREEQAAAQGFFGAIVIAGPVIGPTLGGYLVTNVGWRWMFFINLPVGIGAVMMCQFALPADGALPKKQPIDWTSIALLAIGIGAFQIFLEEGYSEDWFDSPLIVGCAIAAVFGLALFVVRQLESDHPVVDLRVLRYRSLAAGSVLSIVVGIALYGALFALPLFASSVLHYTAQEVGLMLFPGAIASAVSMPIASKLVKKYDPRILLAIGGAILGCAVVWLGMLTPTTSASDLFWPLLVRSFGSILMFLPLSMAALGTIPKAEVAAATSFYNLTRQLGGSIGVAILSTLLGTRNAFHRGVLVEKLAVTDPDVQARLQSFTQGMIAKGADVVTAKQRAYAILDGQTMLQASVLSFNDMFIVTSILIFASIPLAFILRRPGAGVTVDAGH